MPTIHDVAELANVSIATVSRVVNRNAFVSSELEERVQQAIKQLGYRPNVLARHLRRSENPTIGILIPDSKNSFFAEVAKGFEDWCFDHGFVGVLCDTDEQPAKAVDHLELLYERRAAGFAVVSPGQIIPHLQRLLDEGHHIVLLDRALSSLSSDSVVSDNAGGGQLAVQHLASLGHQRIGFIVSNLEHETIQGRMAGVRAAMDAAGLELDPEIVFSEGDELPGSGYEGAGRIMDHPRRPTAIFAFNDLMAFGALRYMHQNGIRVPNDVSVIGFDDMMMASYSSPSLTTVQQPKYEMGQRAAEILLRRIQHEDSPVINLTLPTKLIVRESTAPPKSDGAGKAHKMV